MTSGKRDDISSRCCLGRRKVTGKTEKRRRRRKIRRGKGKETTTITATRGRGGEGEEGTCNDGERRESG